MNTLGPSRRPAKSKLGGFVNGPRPGSAQPKCGRADPTFWRGNRLRILSRATSSSLHPSFEALPPAIRLRPGLPNSYLARLPTRARPRPWIRNRCDPRTAYGSARRADREPQYGATPRRRSAHPRSLVRATTTRPPQRPMTVARGGDVRYGAPIGAVNHQRGSSRRWASRARSASPDRAGARPGLRAAPGGLSLPKRTLEGWTRPRTRGRPLGQPVVASAMAYPDSPTRARPRERASATQPTLTAQQN